MRILLDTHIFLWWITDNPTLSKRARECIGNSQNEIYLSAASCWEMAIKAGLGRLKLPENMEKFISEQLTVNRFLGLPIQLEHAITVRDLPSLHKDPFDRILAVQAKIENLTLVTNDSNLARYDIQIIW
jgi:PIN domain nuclease of toxin-antitoxin system